MLKQIGDYHYLIDDDIIAKHSDWGYREKSGEIAKESNGHYRLKIIGCDNPVITGKRFTLIDFSNTVKQRWIQVDGRALTHAALVKIHSLYKKGASISDTISALMMMY